MYFPEFHPDSRVWVYTSNRPFTTEEESVLKSELDRFMSQWAAHGDSLFGDSIILHNRFVILCVDESKIPASGCSIDTSVRFMKEAGNHLSIDFFNRLNLVVDINGNLQYKHISDVGAYKDEFVFNPMVSTLKELNSNWRIKVSESPFA